MVLTQAQVRLQWMIVRLLLDENLLPILSEGIEKMSDEEANYVSDHLEKTIPAMPVALEILARLQGASMARASGWPPTASAVRVRLHLSGEYHPRTRNAQDELAMDFVACATRSEEERQLWLDGKHPDLGNQTPRHCIHFGQSEAVIAILANTFTGTAS